MRIRYPFLGAFAVIFLGAVYMARSGMEMSEVNDKLLHFGIFASLTLTLYWAIDLPRRALMKVVFGGILAIALLSELAQVVLNGREIDLANIAANLLGTVLSLALCQWYHKRMLERKRRRKYGMIPEGEGEGDLELGDSPGLPDQQMGIIGEEGEEEEDAWDDIDGGEDREGANRESGKANGDW